MGTIQEQMWGKKYSKEEGKIKKQDNFISYNSQGRKRDKSQRNMQIRSRKKEEKTCRWFDKESRLIF